MWMARFSISSVTEQGAITEDGNGTYTFTPTFPGSTAPVEINYLIVDEDGEEASAVATVSVTPGSGDDIVSGPGSYDIDGGEGTDKVVLDGDLSEYAFVDNGISGLSHITVSGWIIARGWNPGTNHWIGNTDFGDYTTTLLVLILDRRCRDPNSY